MSVEKCSIRLLMCVVLLITVDQVVAEKNYSPGVGRNFPNNVFWGDTHLHTRLSVDSYLRGNKVLTSEDAYQFAMGNTVTTHNGRHVKLSRALDFLVIADHAEDLGIMLDIGEPNSQLMRTAIGKKIFDLYSDAPEISDEIWSLMAELNGNSPKFKKSTWEGVVNDADKFNRPGVFTTFSGFEWSSNPGANYDNLHRVVIFKDNAEKVTQVVPYSSSESEDPEDLWRYLTRYQRTTGGDAIAIPHNSNVSNGRMFSPVNFQGQPINLSYAKQRSRWEPLMEVTQIKGDSETHPVVSPGDEFADYETWSSWDGRTVDISKQKQTDSFKPFEYARPALKLGLAQQAMIGGNPFKFGMIGSTDAHTSLATADDNNFWGKNTKDEPTLDRVLKPIMGDVFPHLLNWESAASGYAAVWAQENTRESLFAAMKRKEVYASTGPRITLRFFGGWDYQPDDAVSPDLASIGYSKGVPMGGDLVHAAEGVSPSFLIRAIKDPDGANLDRVQVIKGWHDSSGHLHEKIYNVALS
ncbi:MAG TPA: hypothetical protein DCE52_00995, partial [Rhodobacteraceae bacterium]|nr:hypothetical protein [Paracoccaceae bacterium]